MASWVCERQEEAQVAGEPQAAGRRSGSVWPTPGSCPGKVGVSQWTSGLPWAMKPTTLPVFSQWNEANYLTVMSLQGQGQGLSH